MEGINVSMDIFIGIVIVVIGYLLGSINTSIIVGKIYGINIKKEGSGNAGMTNTLRTIGKKAAVFVIIGDVAKGILSYLIGLFLFKSIGLAPEIGGIIGGVSAVAGHNFPVYFGFKGGKGILTSFAVILMSDWKMGLVLFGIFVIIVAIFRFISLGSIIASACFPILAVILNKGFGIIIPALILGLSAIVMHRTNIRKLIKGTESRFVLNKK
jgi:acyl phosphate:glycerol-3-phosphate acyltransferase